MKNSFLKKIRNPKGFSLAEILIAAGVLIVVIVGLMQLFILCSTLAEAAGNVTWAMTEAQSKMEEIRNHDYDLITTDYGAGGTPGNTFTLTQATGMGVVYIDSSTTGLLKIDVVVCWRNKDGRIVGEDKNLNGVLDAGEDDDSDGKIDSPAVVTTLIARR